MRAKLYIIAGAVFIRLIVIMITQTQDDSKLHQQVKGECVSCSRGVLSNAFEAGYTDGLSHCDPGNM